MFQIEVAQTDREGSPWTLLYVAGHTRGRLTRVRLSAPLAFYPHLPDSVASTNRPARYTPPLRPTSLDNLISTSQEDRPHRLDWTGVNCFLSGSGSTILLGEKAHSSLAVLLPFPPNVTRSTNARLPNSPLVQVHISHFTTNLSRERVPSHLPPNLPVTYRQKIFKTPQNGFRGMIDTSKIFG